MEMARQADNLAILHESRQETGGCCNHDAHERKGRESPGSTEPTLRPAGHRRTAQTGRSGERRNGAEFAVYIPARSHSSRRSPETIITAE